MELTAGQIAAIISGELQGDPDQVVHGVAGLREAQPGDVAFVASPKYFAAVKESAASVLIAAPDAAVDEFQGPIIRIEKPAEAFARLVEEIAPPAIRHAPGVSDRAAIHASVQLGRDVCIQPFAVIEENAVIGDRTVIGAGCYIGAESRVGADGMLYPSVVLRERTVIGDRVILHGGVVLGADGFGFEFKDGKHEKIPQLGWVELGHDVEIGANSAIDRGRFGKSRIGDGTKIDNLVQIGHNCVIGKHCVVCGLVGMAGSTIIGDYVTIAGQVGIAGHLKIGDKSIIMAQAGVTKDVPPGSFMLGAPAVPHRKFKQINAAIQRLPQTAARFREIEKLLTQLQERLGEAK